MAAFDNKVVIFDSQGKTVCKDTKMPHIEQDNYLKNNIIFSDFRCYNVGGFYIKEKRIKQDLLLVYAGMEAIPGNKPFQSEGASHFRGISIALNLEGGFCFENEQVSLKVAKNSTHILYTPRANGHVSFQTNSFSGIYLMIGDEFMGSHFFEHLNVDLGKEKVLKNQKTSPITWVCFRDLVTSPYEGVLGQMFSESKALEIITNELGSILLPRNKGDFGDKIILTDKDGKALNKAWQILVDNIDKPPSIKELARKVAINEYKLKAGFKQLFGTTPYAVVRAHRMKMAKKLLESSEYNVSEISRMVGIKNQAHFTRSFYNCYKILPRDVMKSRRYFFLKAE